MQRQRPEPCHFESVAKEMMKKSKRLTSRQFKASFGISSAIAALVRDDLLPEGAHLKHLLYAMSFMKEYAPWDSLALKYHCCEKTFRDWSWLMIEKLYMMDVVSC